VTEERPARAGLIGGRRATGTELFQQMLGRRHLEVAGRFDVQFLDDAVLDQHREALAARAEAELAAVHG